MLIEPIAGGWCISALVEGYLVTRRYIGYTKREAVSLFKQGEMK